MPIKKSALYSSLWKSCDALRGGMDASQYKDYVLALLFVKYVSDKASRQKDSAIVVPPGGSFTDLVEARGKPNIGERINTVLAKLAKANDLEGVINVADFDDANKLGNGKERQDRLTRLIGIFQRQELDFSRNRADGDDLLGDAYEYLMQHFAIDAGKSKGQFYTPAEVSQVIAKVIGIPKDAPHSLTIYDPTCGSGSLLLKAAAEAPTGLTIYGQEVDNATAALAKMNMVLHNHEDADIWKGNTLSEPHWIDNGTLRQFNFAVANPPFSTKAWSTGFNPSADTYARFPYGVPPDKNGDYAFFLHLLASLDTKTGKGAIILPHGVLFRGGAEGQLRREIITRGYIKGIIGLPANLFYGTGIPACIIVLDKENAEQRDGIFMIDASKGFVKDGSKNRLRHQDIHRIVDVFNAQRDTTRFARMVSLEEIAANDYNLNIPRYIDSSDAPDLHDIPAHLLGGIPNTDLDAFAKFWNAYPGLREELFAPLRPGYSTLNGDINHIRATIAAHREVQAYDTHLRAEFSRWRSKAKAEMQDIGPHKLPAVLIETISEALLSQFAKDAEIVDKYDVYQRLMTYWADVMKDDVHVLVVDGWGAATKLRVITADPTADGKKDPNKETADFVINGIEYKADLLPPAIVIRRYFAAEQAALDKLNQRMETLEAQRDSLIEEHGGEDGLLTDAKTEKDTITKTSVEGRLKQLKKFSDDDDEKRLLIELSTLDTEIATLKKNIKTQSDALNTAVFNKYSQLSETDTRTMIVDEKWLASIADAVQGELGRLALTLAGRLKQLAERYATPLPTLQHNADATRAKVTAHLQRMGFSW